MSHLGVCLPLPPLLQVEGRSPSFTVPPLDPAHAAKVRAANEIVRNSWQFKVGEGAAGHTAAAAAGAERRQGVWLGSCSCWRGEAAAWEVEQAAAALWMA
jgi:hypothetical protein